MRTTTEASGLNEKSPVSDVNQNEAKNDSGANQQDHANDIIGGVFHTSTTSGMSSAESSRLIELESLVDRGRRAFLETGAALLAIRDERLYRSSHRSFEEYARDRFDIGRSQAYRLLDTASVSENVPNWGQIKTESQAREVAKAPPERQAAVVERAAEIADHRRRPLSASIVAEAREQINDPASFHELVSSMGIGDVILQGVDADHDWTAIERVDGGYRLIRVLGDQFIDARLRTSAQVTWALEESDADYSVASGLLPFVTIESEEEASVAA